MRIWPQLTVREEGLFFAGQDSDVWPYLTAFPYAAETRERFGRWMEQALTESAAGREGAFAIIDRHSGTPIGSTRYLALRPRASRARDWLDLARACLVADRRERRMQAAPAPPGVRDARLRARRAENRRPQRPLARGHGGPSAQFEGIHRRHIKIPEGWRDTAWYSVIAPEWPTVRAVLRQRLARHGIAAYSD